MLTSTVKIVTFLLAIAVFSGQAWASSHRARPDLEARAKGIQSILLLPPKVEVFQLDAGGVKETIDEWTVQASKNLVTAVEEKLKSGLGYQAIFLSEDSLSEEVKSNLEETYGLFYAVNAGILLHTYSPPGPPGWVFEDKVKDFDYSLGTEVRGLRRGEVEALLMIKGHDHIWTEGRKALQFFAVVLGIGARVGLGVGTIPIFGGNTELSVALVDSNTGSILWYSHVGSLSGYDLRESSSVTSLVEQLFKDFPTAKEEKMQISE